MCACALSLSMQTSLLFHPPLVAVHGDIGAIILLSDTPVQPHGVRAKQPSCINVYLPLKDKHKAQSFGFTKRGRRDESGEREDLRDVWCKGCASSALRQRIPETIDSLSDILFVCAAPEAYVLNTAADETFQIPYCSSNSRQSNSIY